MKHHEITHALNKKEFDDRFLKKLKFQSRGVKDADVLLNTFLHYYNTIEGYISEVELENLRLLKENEILAEKYVILRSDYIDTSNELISGLMKRVKFLDKKL